MSGVFAMNLQKTNNFPVAFKLLSDPWKIDSMTMFTQNRGFYYFDYL